MLGELGYNREEIFDRVGDLGALEQFCVGLDQVPDAETLRRRLLELAADGQA